MVATLCSLVLLSHLCPLYTRHTYIIPSIHPICCLYCPVLPFILSLNTWNCIVLHDASTALRSFKKVSLSKICDHYWHKLTAVSLGQRKTRTLTHCVSGGGRGWSRGIAAKWKQLLPLTYLKLSLFLQWLHLGLVGQSSVTLWDTFPFHFLHNHYCFPFPKAAGREHVRPHTISKVYNLQHKRKEGDRKDSLFISATFLSHLWAVMQLHSIGDNQMADTSGPPPPHPHPRMIHTKDQSTQLLDSKSGRDNKLKQAYLICIPTLKCRCTILRTLKPLRTNISLPANGRIWSIDSSIETHRGLLVPSSHKAKAGNIPTSRHIPHFYLGAISSLQST